MIVASLRENRLACRRNDGDLVFANSRGNMEDRTSIASAASTGADCRWHHQGREGRQADRQYPGLYSLRHFYASWCINRKVDGGLELPLKVVQARLGHASIQMTADTYGHLFPRGDDGSELAAAERAFLAG